MRPLTDVSIPRSRARAKDKKQRKRVIRNKAIQGGKVSRGNNWVHEDHNSSSRQRVEEEDCYCCCCYYYYYVNSVAEQRGYIWFQGNSLQDRRGGGGWSRLSLFLFGSGIQAVEKPGEGERGGRNWRNRVWREREVGWREMKKDEYTREEHRETRTTNNRDLCGSGDRKVYKRKRDIAKGGEDRWMEGGKRGGRERERREGGRMGE